ncbi:uncharacterized protein LOC105156954 [Sesamum indicum]|uniref:Uncharacterized protein LOC105156954 n=1 Tax=Sesamum indicum TaxID=4182 RepID=A0A6I9SNE5_SESIN|nr:uncharacterized protein LOC105156954 [Sesamum indicum]
MKKGIHPQMQWISYVTQSGRLMNVMMTKIHQVGKVYHFRAKRQMAESIGQIAKTTTMFTELVSGLLMLNLALLWVFLSVSLFSLCIRRKVTTGMFLI